MPRTCFGGYKIESVPANSSSKYGRGSGGVLVGIRQDVSMAISVLPIYHDNVMWLEVYAGRKLACAVVYSRTSEERYGHVVDELYEFLVESVNKLKTSHEIVVMGDFNSRIGEIVGDRKVNENGKKFINFLETTGLAMLNTDYFFGVPTFLSADAEKSSIVDYVLVDSRLEDRIVEARVAPNDIGSDHRAIVASLKLDGELHTFEIGGLLRVKSLTVAATDAIRTDLRQMEWNNGVSSRFLQICTLGLTNGSLIFLELK